MTWFYVWVAYFVYTYGPYILAAVLFGLAIREANKPKRNVKTAGMFVGVALLLALVHPIGNFFEQRQYQEEVSPRLGLIDYQLYSYKAPKGLSYRSVSTTVKTDELLNNADIFDKKFDDESRAYLVEGYGGQDSPIYVRQFDSNEFPGSIEVCYPVDPEFPDYTNLTGGACAEIGTSNLGTKIYAAMQGGAYRTMFTGVGDTRITVEIITPSYDNAESLKEIFDTLKPIDKAKLKFKDG